MMIQMKSRLNTVMDMPSATRNATPMEMTVMMSFLVSMPPDVFST